MKKLRTWIALAILGAVAASPTPAAAQASRTGPTFMIGGSTSPVILPDVAYDTLHDRYLVVQGNGSSRDSCSTRWGNRFGLPVRAWRRRVRPEPHAWRSAPMSTAAPAAIWSRGIESVGLDRPGLGQDSFRTTAGPHRRHRDRARSRRCRDGLELDHGRGHRLFDRAAKNSSSTWMGGYFTTQDIRFTRVNTAGTVLQFRVGHHRRRGLGARSVGRLQPASGRVLHHLCRLPRCRPLRLRERPAHQGGHGRS